jgi:hypothetical protein
VIVAESDLAAEHDEADEAQVVAAVEGLERELGPDPRDWGGILLAESRWGPDEADGVEAGRAGAGNAEAGAAEAGSAGAGAEVAGEFLLRLGDRYVIYETNGAEWDWSELQAPDDAAAIEAFIDSMGD